MRYKVRTPEGELTMPSRHELQQAYTYGLIGPEDEVLEEGGTVWRKASSLPGLYPPSASRTALSPGEALRLVAVVVLGLLALGLVLSGEATLAGVGVALAFLLVGWLFAYTRRAFQLRRKG
jgi:hypothetical protein